MVITNLLPGGIMQLWDVMQNGYWQARDIAYMSGGYVHLLEWLRTSRNASPITTLLLSRIAWPGRVIRRANTAAAAVCHRPAPDGFPG